MKLKALVTAEVNRDWLEKDLSQHIEFVYDGYHINHEVMPHQELCEKIGAYDILICEYDTVSSDVLDAATNLKLIICCRGGIKDVVDITKAKSQGIVVCNNAGRNAGAVSDIVIGYILDMTRNISLTNNLIHSKELTADVSTKPDEYKDIVWGLDNNSPFIRFRGKSINHMKLGVFGFGCVGRLLAQKAYAFNMEILAYDPFLDSSKFPDYVTAVGFDELFRESDIISVHCPTTDQTRNMFNIDLFNKMKDGAYFINTSRGEVVVEEDLVEALKCNKLAGAAIDVTRVEPISSNSILLTAPNLIITPHIAGSSYDVQCCGTQMVMDSLVDFINGEKPANCVG